MEGLTCLLMDSGGLLSLFFILLWDYSMRLGHSCGVECAMTCINVFYVVDYTCLVRECAASPNMHLSISLPTGCLCCLHASTIGLYCIPIVLVFLGFVNYYRSFIKNFIAIVGPLTELIKEGMTWQWGLCCHRAFQSLKDALFFAPILLFPNLKLLYIMVRYANDTETRGVLMQDQGGGLQPLAFISRKLKPTE